MIHIWYRDVTASNRICPEELVVPSWNHKYHYCFHKHPLPLHISARSIQTISPGTTPLTSTSAPAIARLKPIVLFLISLTCTRHTKLIITKYSDHGKPLTLQHFFELCDLQSHKNMGFVFPWKRWHLFSSATFCVTAHTAAEIIDNAHLTK
jgi:hypothetical protein